MADAPPPPTADSQEIAAGAPPDGGGLRLGGSEGGSDTTLPATKLPETVETHTPDPGKKASKKPASRPARRGLIVLAATAIALMIAGLGILVLERDAVMAAASRLTALIGLEEPPGAGLEIGAVTSLREEAADGDVLVVQGTVSNPTDEARPLPGIRVSLFDTDDTELQHVTVVPDQEMLAAGESIAFSARLEQPAPTAKRIKVTFAARSATT
jgi:hypothetical protein